MESTPQTKWGVFGLPTIHGSDFGFRVTWVEAEDGTPINVRIRCLICHEPYIAVDTMSPSRGRTLCYLKCPRHGKHQALIIAAMRRRSLFDWIVQTIQDGSYDPVPNPDDQAEE